MGVSSMPPPPPPPLFHGQPRPVRQHPCSSRAHPRGATPMSQQAPVLDDLQMSEDRVSQQHLDAIRLEKLELVRATETMRIGELLSKAQEDASNAQSVVAQAVEAIVSVTGDGEALKRTIEALLAE